MYGLLLENLSEYIKAVYGEDKWEDIRRQAGVDSPSFSVHQVYPENMLNKLAKKAQQVLGVSERDFMDQLGVCFVGFVGQYGYDRVLSVLGRHMRDFLNGLDNLHEYLKFSYPRMRAPSFSCENETKQGLTLHYRSKRRGFVYYTMGQIREVARYFYHKEMHIELVREEILFDTVHVTFQLTFDNRAFTLASLAMTREEKHLPISAHVLFEIFPFCIVFGADMVVRSMGNSLMVILPELLGKKINAWFDLVRPLIGFKFQTILNRTNNIFELVTVEPVGDRNDGTQEPILLHDDGSEPERNLRLKGQMVYMDNWKMIMFLGTPVMPDLSSLITTGLYINDLSMHDFSRDLMLAGTQQSVELKLALDQEQQKSKKLEESMRKLDEEMRRTDELLYQMIPKQVADRLRRGENPIDTCEMFDCVSILFSDVVTFTEICSRITPMEVVSMLNAMYSIFDTLTERNSVYKVETIGDAYMVVAGAPEKDPNHAEKVCDMALDMVDAIKDLKDPSTGQHLRIRVGVHSGAVVAGIVGLKMPRYCLFGDSVNTASRMESTSTAMKVHVSESTKEFLGSNYKLVERGEVDVKGKGTMKTYWLEERENRTPLQLSSAILHPTSPYGAASAQAAKSSSPAAAVAVKPDINVAAANTMVTTPPLKPTASEDRSPLYEPVTFNEVKRRSIAGSPVRSLCNVAGSTKVAKDEKPRESRSNSTGHVVMRSPSDIFGSLIIDTEEFLEDLQSARNSTGINSKNIALSPIPRFRVGSAPSKPRHSHPDDFTFEEKAVMDRPIPPSTAPPRDHYPTNMLPSVVMISDIEKNKYRTGENRSTATDEGAAKASGTTTAISGNEATISLHNPSNAIATFSNQNVAANLASTSAAASSNPTSTCRPSTEDSISLHSPPPIRSLSAPLPMSKAARKAFLAAKQTRAMERLDKMIEEVSEADTRERNLHIRLLNLGRDDDPAAQSSFQNEDLAMGGCPLFLLPPPPPPPPQQRQQDPQSTVTCPPRPVINSISDSSICNQGHSHASTIQPSPTTSCPHLTPDPKMSNSQSFTQPKNPTGPITHHCCSGFNQSNERHSHRMHSNACQIL